MSPEKILEVVSVYEAIFAQLPKQQLAQYDAFPTSHELLCHLHWMCGEMRGFVEQGKIDKAFRWLGFIQGVLAAKELRTVDQLREDSRST